ncbi:hypothetical protein A6M14_13365 [Acinetobacter sp. Ac_877]|uniref:hypothetical protein n=1 Tax=Acinetobacter portensis TaxID=1839785 RepID=UPI00128E323F|nr:hypothetical protein [Acinetobacter portensis]MPW42681.1 hypothetical protein [Acinetobacter portensis]
MAIRERNNPKLLWGIIGFLILIIAVIFAYLNFSSTEDESKLNTETPASEAVVASEPDLPASDVIPTEANTSALISDKILQEAVPKNASLAKEEVAKLSDIQSQLKNQEKILKEQHSDVDQLIELKEEQIKLLEAQLAESQ